MDDEGTVAMARLTDEGSIVTLLPVVTQQREIGRQKCSRSRAYVCRGRRLLRGRMRL